jgi:ATP-dependent DNA helicase PIF1
MELSDEQNEAYNKYIEGKNIFITGPGGSGKSELIRKIYQDAKEKGKNINVCALTGCAAVLLQCKAKTIHSWAGLGLGSGTIEANIKKVIDKEFKKKNWKETQILIIDEVSMLSLKLFEMLDRIGRKVRKCESKPFGGIQIIFSGDFYQLPPVGNKDEPETMQFYSHECEVRFVIIDNVRQAVFFALDVRGMFKRCNHIPDRLQIVLSGEKRIQC